LPSLLGVDEVAGSWCGVGGCHGFTGSDAEVDVDIRDLFEWHPVAKDALLSHHLIGANGFTGFESEIGFTAAAMVVSRAYLRIEAEALDSCRDANFSGEIVHG